MNVLIVDAERSVADGLANALYRDGYDALPLYDPEEATDVAEDTIFDVAFLAMESPHMNGAELELRLGKLLPFCRFVLYGKPELVERGKLLGQKDCEYLTTPLQTEEVLNKAREVENQWAYYDWLILGELESKSSGSLSGEANDFEIP